jgi:hypothetical protein
LWRGLRSGSYALHLKRIFQFQDGHSTTTRTAIVAVISAIAIVETPLTGLIGGGGRQGN